MARDRHDLLHAAADYALKTGFQGTSMEDIAVAIGVPRTALYYHFGTKGNILFEILISGVETALAKVQEVSQYPLSPEDRLALTVRALLIHNLNSAAANLATTHHVNSPLLSDEQRDRLRAARDALDAAFRALLQESIKSGAFRLVDVRVVSNVILSAIGRLQSWYRADGPLSMDDVAAIYNDIFLCGLRAEPTVPARPSKARQTTRSSTRRREERKT